MQDRPHHPPLPWYRHFWPWFIVGMLASAVLASLASLAIALVHADPVVRDDWYRDGTAINRRIERDLAARRLGIAGSLSVDEVRHELRLDLGGDGLEPLQEVRLELSHATRAERDRGVVLGRSDDGSFRAAFEAPGSGSWYATLTPVLHGAPGAEAADWRLSRRLELPTSEPLRFGGGP